LFGINGNLETKTKIENFRVLYEHGKRKEGEGVIKLGGAVTATDE